MNRGTTPAGAMFGINGGNCDIPHAYIHGAEAKHSISTGDFFKEMLNVLRIL